jgi:methionine-rich copper-binding protein CopC
MKTAFITVSLALGSAVGLTVATLPIAASAHSVATHTSPANGSVLTVAPTEFQITLNEAARLTKLTLQKAGDAKAQELGPLPKDPQQFIAIAAPKLGAGGYILRYRTVSSDNHIMPGVIKFTIAGSAKVATPGK